MHFIMLHATLSGSDHLDVHIAADHFSMSLAVSLSLIAHGFWTS